MESVLQKAFRKVMRVMISLAILSAFGIILAISYEEYKEYQNYKIGLAEIQAEAKAKALKVSK